MELNSEVFVDLSAIAWFGRCGTELPNDLPFRVQRVPDISAAITSALGSSWQDARTEAQGDLTGYLAEHHYDAYDYWNQLSRMSRDRIQKEIMPSVNEVLRDMRAQSLSDSVLLDLTRIALWFAYSKRFRRVPDFFETLLVVYEHGHLPCGWSGDLAQWPEGRLIVY